MVSFGPVPIQEQTTLVFDKDSRKFLHQNLIKLKQNPAILSKIPRKFSENSTKVKENLTKFEENPSNIKKSSNAQNFVLSFSITVISAVILLAIVSFILVKGLK